MNKTLGQKIREWRMRKGITQTELAEGLVTPSMISQIESDKANPSFKLLEGISRKLDVPIDQFLMDMQDKLEHDTRHKLAKSLISAKQYEKAIQVLEGLADEPAVDRNEVRKELASAYIYAKQFDNATRLLESMLEEVALDKDRSHAVELLRWLGRAKMEQHDYVMAKHYFQQAMKELAKSESLDNSTKGSLYHNFAATLAYLGEVQEAIEYYKKAITALQGTPNLLQMGRTYTALATAYYHMNEYAQAADTTRTAITMFRSVNNRYDEVVAKKNYGILQYELGQYDDAIAQFEECAEEFKAMEEMDLVANVYGEIGTVYFRRKNYQEAEKWCFRALELLGKEHRERAFVYRTMGVMYQELQNFERALEYMLSSVELFEKYGLHVEASKCYSHIVSIYEARGELDKASEYMQKMTSTMREGLRVRGLYL
ncbi:DNA-binding XRE family transcriptional regulator [Tumebacillus sp. BK434]|uniref:tetratricopeptide repeat protein n=1 Tax=Tumebacillus sp. BK434 TaxID=2512169 RepID=UPI00104A6D61|nr:tetratricopeptide repeat protein [Tumebacillus sp. BK434]TCP57793.1 DNA-binding XRE family transcriptional regulator [Tumebacillus sp. BK434]